MTPTPIPAFAPVDKPDDAEDGELDEVEELADELAVFKGSVSVRDEVLDVRLEAASLLVGVAETASTVEGTEAVSSMEVVGV